MTRKNYQVPATLAFVYLDQRSLMGAHRFSSKKRIKWQTRRQRCSLWNFFLCSGWTQSQRIGYNMIWNCWTLRVVVNHSPMTRKQVIYGRQFSKHANLWSRLHNWRFLGLRWGRGRSRRGKFCKGKRALRRKEKWKKHLSHTWQAANASNELFFAPWVIKNDFQDVVALKEEGRSKELPKEGTLVQLTIWLSGKDLWKLSRSLKATDSEIETMESETQINKKLKKVFCDQSSYSEIKFNNRKWKTPFDFNI